MQLLIGLIRLYWKLIIARLRNSTPALIRQAEVSDNACDVLESEKFEILKNMIALNTSNFINNF